MRLAVLGFCALGLFGCASPEANQVATEQCETVGITPGDPNFAVCMQAYRQSRREGALNQNYHNAINAVPDDRRRAHDWVF